MKKEVIKQLNKLYPNKVVTGLKQNTHLYYNVKQLAERMNKSNDDYLRSIGFKVQRASNSNFDTHTVKKLIDIYGVKQTDIGEWQGVSRQNISDNIKRQVQGPSWVIDKLDSKDQNIFENMICQKEFYNKINGTSYIIKSNFHNGPCFIIIRSQKVNVLFEQSEKMKELLKTSKMDTLGEVDFKIVESLEEIMFLKEPYARPKDKKTSNLIIKQTEKYKITKDEYCKLHGFKGYNKNRINDNEILERIENNIHKDNYVKLPHASDDYDFFNSHANRNGMSIDEFVSVYGFIRLDTRLEEINKSKRDDFKKELKKLADKNQKVYLDFNTNFYQNIYNYTRKRGLNLNKFISELGFERIYRRRGNVEYRKEQSNSSLSKEQNKKVTILSELKEIQGNLRRIITATEKVSRNQKLVKKLKDLYDHKCQLCSKENPIPIIETKEGNPYVEVHHIIPIGTSKELSDNVEIEYKQLDTYKNAIVVCSHHHRVLHTHLGGYEKVIKKDGKLYFESESGDRLKIELTDHIEVPLSRNENKRHVVINRNYNQKSEKIVV